MPTKSTKTAPPAFEKSNLAVRFITKQQLAEYLSCSPRQIEKLVAAGRLPARKLGRRMIRFDLPRCEAALARYDIAAIGEDR